MMVKAWAQIEDRREGALQRLRDAAWRHVRALEELRAAEKELEWAAAHFDKVHSDHGEGQKR